MLMRAKVHSASSLEALFWKGRQLHIGHAVAEHSRIASLSQPQHSRQKAFIAEARDFPDMALR